MGFETPLLIALWASLAEGANRPIGWLNERERVRELSRRFGYLRSQPTLVRRWVAASEDAERVRLHGAKSLQVAPERCSIATMAGLPEGVLPQTSI